MVILLLVIFKIKIKKRLNLIAYCHMLNYIWVSMKSIFYWKGEYFTFLSQMFFILSKIYKELGRDGPKYRHQILYLVETLKFK